jgi:hypothetical protein
VGPLSRIGRKTCFYKVPIPLDNEIVFKFAGKILL